MDKMKLADLQFRFANALFDRADTPLVEWLLDEQFSSRSLLDIYRDSVFASLTTVLSETFPSVKRFLGDTDFQNAAEAFVRAYPPLHPSLYSYGEHFPGFLAKYFEEGDTKRLRDLARKEWLAHKAAQNTFNL